MPKNHLLINLPVYYLSGTLVSRPQHFHGHAELLYVLSGELKLCLSEETRVLSEGDACFLFPNILHGYERVGSEKELHLLVNFAPEYIGACKETLLSSRPVDSVIHFGKGDTNFKTVFETACDSYNRRGKASTAKSADDTESETDSDGERLFSSEIVRGCTVSLCAMALERLKLLKTHSQSMRTMQLIIKYCLENYTGKLTLEKLSNELNISRHYISHLFACEFKMGFLEYINSLRVARAKEQLVTTQEKISDISASCGFESTRTFNRVFLSSTGKTPKEWREGGGL